MAYKPSYISPSSADRFFACPGSVREQQKIEVLPETNEYAKEGSAIHELAAWCLQTGKSPKDHKADIVIEGTSFKVTEEFQYVAMVYLNTIYRELGVETDGESRPKNGPQKGFQVEEKFKLDWIDKKANGTTDLVYLHGSTLYVFDLKTGRKGLVSAEENKQLLYYALAPYKAAALFVENVVLYIVQPRGMDGDYFKKWETTPNRLNKFNDELAKAIQATKVKDAPLNPGDHCSYCVAAATCPALHGQLVKGVESVLPDINKWFPVVTNLTPEKIGAALYALEALDKYRDALQSYAFHMAKNGTEIPNYCLTQSKPHRKWRDEDAVVSAFEEELGEQLWEPKKILSPAKLEKLMGKGKLDSYICQPEGELKLSLKKDCVEEIKSSVEEAFKNVQIENQD